MQKINLNNYEAYLLDYLEGNLSVEEIHDLKLFLEANPDKRQELDIDLNDFVIEPLSVQLANKDFLKVDDSDLITAVNVEEWMIESLEKTISADKQLELNDFIKKHQLEKSMSYFSATKLTADLNEKFENKKSLKVPEGVVIPLYLRYVAAAAVVVLIVSIALNFNRENQPAYLQESAKVNIPDKLQIVTPEHLAKESDFVYSNSKSNNNFNSNQFAETRIKELLKDSTDKSLDNVFQEENKVVFAKDSLNNNQEIELLPDDNLIVVNDDDKTVVFDEPYKLITNAAGNFINKEVKFARGKETASDEYVAYEFKIGNFEFSRKK